MQIRTVGIVGLGSLGIMYGNHLAKHIDHKNLKIIATKERIDRYRRDGVYCNGEGCDFNYLLPDEKSFPLDLLIFAVKYNDLKAAIKDVQMHVGPKTRIISLLNGIGSEEIIGQTFGMDHIIYSVAQGMDATKTGNRVEYHNMGLICFGSMQSSTVDPDVEMLREFFDKVQLPYELADDMRNKLWGKFMLNVGVNQAVTVFECDYGGILRPGKARNLMIAAMEEVITLSQKENVNLKQEDLLYWLKVLDALNPSGKPSMRQDLEAKRKSEVELFSGAVLALSRKHNIESPVNQFFYDTIKEMEARFYIF